MSSEKLCARAAHLQPSRTDGPMRKLIDSTIRATGKTIRSNRTTQQAFYRLANSIRGQSNLLSPQRLNTASGFKQMKTILQVCQNLARHQSRWQRGPESWNRSSEPQTNDSSQIKNPVKQPEPIQSYGKLIRSLIDHLLGTAPVPPFMYRCWFGDAVLPHQKLFLHVAAGNSIRGTEFGKSLTKQMAAQLMDAPANSSFEEAQRFVKYGYRINRKIHYPIGVTRRRRKALIVKPRYFTPRNVHWARIPINDFYLTKKVSGNNVIERTWSIKQLTSRSELRQEGHRLRHCVADYWEYCLEGRSSIWAMESQDVMRTSPLVTIEIDPATKEICQIKGYANRNPRKNELAIIQQWAKQESLEFENSQFES